MDDETMDDGRCWMADGGFNKENGLWRWWWMTEDGFDGDELMMVHFHMVGADDQRSNEHLATTSYSIRTQPLSGLPLTFRVHEMQAVEQKYGLGGKGE